MKRTTVCRTEAPNLTPRNSTRLRLQQSTLKVLDEFKYVAIQFAAKNISHHHLRLEYLNLVSEICRLVLRHVDEYSYQYPSRSCDIWREALDEATKLKNEMSEYLKGITSSFGRSISKMIISHGGTYPEFIQSFAQKLFHTNFMDLSFSQQERIFVTIIRQTVRTNLVLVSIRRWCGKLGVIYAIVTVGILMFNISVALRPTYYHISRAVALGFGASSCCVGSELGAEISACGGPVGVFLGGLIDGLNVAFVVSLGNEGILRILARLIFPASTSEFHIPLSIRGYRDLYNAPTIRKSSTSHITSGGSSMPKHSYRRRSRSAPPVIQGHRKSQYRSEATTHLPIFNVPKYRSTIPPSTSTNIPDIYPSFPGRNSYLY